MSHPRNAFRGGPDVPLHWQDLPVDVDRRAINVRAIARQGWNTKRLASFFDLLEEDIARILGDHEHMRNESTGPASSTSSRGAARTAVTCAATSEGWDVRTRTSCLLANRVLVPMALPEHPAENAIYSTRRKPTLSALPDQAWFDRIRAEYDLPPETAALLQVAEDAWRRYNDIVAQISREGLTVEGRWGIPKPHPLLGLEARYRNSVIAAIQALHIPKED